MQALTVSELTFSIKQTLESRFLTVRVQGEVSNLTLHSSGHLYFTLKDEKSQISCAFFRNARKEKNTFKHGDQIIVSGDLSVYPPRGSYQIIVKEVEPVGVGKLLLELQARKEKLQKKGWFSLEKKKPLPAFPKKIGVITSPTGAVIRDIVHVLRRRSPGFHLILYPVKVQGDTAKNEIAQAIYECNEKKICDLLIVGRGGGSLEDLWAFNEEIVAEAVFHSDIPIISAVGHEIDYTICDLVADIRAPTPSAAAELAVKETQSLIEYMQSIQRKMEQKMQDSIEGKKKNLALLTRLPHFSDPSYFLAKSIQMLDEKSSQLDRSIQYKLDHTKGRLRHMMEKWEQKNTYHQIQEKKKRLESYQNHLHAINPKQLLKKGYTILFSKNKSSVIVSSKEIEVGDTIFAKLQDGDLKAEVTHKDTNYEIV